MLSPSQVGVLERPLAPKASLGACDTLAGLHGDACPNAPLCISFGALYLVRGINGVVQSSVVSEQRFSPALKALYNEGCCLCLETQSPSQLSSRPLENAGKLPFRKLGFPPGLSHCCQGWRCWVQGDGASHPPGMIPLARLTWC